MKVIHLKNLFGNKCYYCGCKARSTATVEHLIPVAQCKINHDCNCRVAHYGCNQIRGKMYQCINNIFKRICYQTNIEKSRKQLEFCIKHLTKQDGIWTQSYFDELQFAMEHTNFIQDMLNGVFTNLFFRRNHHANAVRIRS